MAEFKVGDLVRRKRGAGANMAIKPGDVCVVQSVDDVGWMRLGDEGEKAGHLHSPRFYERALPDSDYPDVVNSPSHYRANGMEAIDVIEAFLTEEEARGYRKGNALKYLLRSGRKDAIDVDLKKLRWYVNRELAKHEEADA